MNKKQKITLLAIAAATILLGALILGFGKGKGGEEVDGDAAHGHSEVKGHKDTEHHGIDTQDEHKDADEHGDDEHHETAEKGKRGGEILTKGDFSMEFVLAEADEKAFFVAYPTKDGKPVAPASIKMNAVLTRPSGEEQRVEFVPKGDALQSVTSIVEPHIFSLKINVQVNNGGAYVFELEKEEGKVELTDAQIKEAGISLLVAGPAKVASNIQLPAEIKFNQDRTAHVVPRIAGIVESVPANLGQQVKKGQLLALISSTAASDQRSELLTAQERLKLARSSYQREKKLWEEKISAEQDYLHAQQAMREAEIAARNAQQKLAAMGISPASGALNRYEIRAPFDGMIVEKHISLGESIREDANVFTVSDLSTVWAEIIVPANKLDVVRVGETATVRSSSFESTSTGKVSYVGALLGEQTRTATARIVLPNPKGFWRPGLFVSVDIVAEEKELPVVVSIDALQSIEEKPTVFVRVKGGFAPQEVRTGRRDSKQIEIVDGLKPGTTYAAAGSFVLKSEQGKSSAEHTH